MTQICDFSWGLPQVTFPWQLRSIVNVGKSKNSYIPSILDKKPVDDPNAIANIFNNFLAAVGKTTEKRIPHGNYNHLFYLRVTTRDQSFYPQSLHMKLGLWLIIWMPISLPVPTVYHVPYWNLAETIYNWATSIFSKWFLYNW